MIEAAIVKGSIVIRVPMKSLKDLVEGAWALGSLDTRMKITDAKAFADELVSAINCEDEEGTTPLHRLFDAAINDALEQGAEGIEEHEEQDA